MRKFLVEELDFKVCIYDGCILMKKDLVLGLYVDDIIVTGEFDVVEDFIKNFRDRFKSRYYEQVKDFIGCELKWDMETNSVLLHQMTMIEKLELKMKPYLEKYDIKTNKVPMIKGAGIRQLTAKDMELSGEMQSLYRSCVGSLL